MAHKPKPKRTDNPFNAVLVAHGFELTNYMSHIYSYTRPDGSEARFCRAQATSGPWGGTLRTPDNTVGVRFVDAEQLAKAIEQGCVLETGARMVVSNRSGLDHPSKGLVGKFVGLTKPHGYARLELDDGKQVQVHPESLDAAP